LRHQIITQSENCGEPSAGGETSCQKAATVEHEHLPSCKADILHQQLLEKSGYKPWERELKVTGGEIKLTAELEK